MKTLTILILVGGGLLIIGIIVLIVLLYIRYIRKKIIHDYALDPESFMEKKNLSI